LRGKTAPVTAAAAANGRASAVRMTAEGAHVIDDKALALLTCERPQTRGLDVTDSQAIEALVSELGPIDVLSNCVGIVRAGTVLDCTHDD
jgi:2-keto-3-deoxy-L-fuconate dehydrogenase